MLILIHPAFEQYGNETNLCDLPNFGSQWRQWILIFLPIPKRAALLKKEH